MMRDLRQLLTGCEYVMFERLHKHKGVLTGYDVNGSDVGTLNRLVKKKVAMHFPETKETDRHWKLVGEGYDED